MAFDELIAPEDPIIWRIVEAVVNGTLSEKLVKSIEPIINIGKKFPSYLFTWYYPDAPRESIIYEQLRLDFSYEIKNNIEVIHVYLFIKSSEKHNTYGSFSDFPLKDWDKICEQLSDKLYEERKRHKPLKYRLRKAESQKDKAISKIKFYKDKLNYTYIDTSNIF